MASKEAHTDGHGSDEDHGFQLGENLRGAVIVALGSAALIGLAWGAMVVLTSPEGWVTKAANSAISGDDVQLVSFADDNGQ
jgi:hypothetical protein